ncbi:MAG TPA: riboflavin synthase [Actinomycetota bacterium]|nr:riboflavin synthase [Actinomycetota bacterium]
MFTGIVEELGHVVSRAGSRIVVRCPIAASEAAIGDSISIDGVCLTVVGLDGDEASFDISPETFDRTSLGGLAPDDRVNVERPATLVSRLGGHLVQGHVDGVALATAVRPDAEGGARLSVRLPGDLLRYVVEKGSITLSGVSLTVAAIDDDEIDVALIPHTLAVTTLGAIRTGDPLNVEVDVVAKYVARNIESLIGDGVAVESGKERTT